MVMQCIQTVYVYCHSLRRIEHYKILYGSCAFCLTNSSVAQMQSVENQKFTPLVLVHELTE